MAHNEIEGNVISEVWRAQETAKEITYFLVKVEKNWYRIEYTGELILERANYIADKLKAAAQGGSSIEVVEGPGSRNIGIHRPGVQIRSGKNCR